jgi:hypothetical protein
MPNKRAATKNFILRITKAHSTHPTFFPIAQAAERNEAFFPSFSGKNTGKHG